MLPVQLGDNPDAGDPSEKELEQDTPASGINIRMRARGEDAAEDQYAAGHSKHQPFPHHNTPPTFNIEDEVRVKEHAFSGKEQVQSLTTLPGPRIFVRGKEFMMTIRTKDP